MTARLAAVAAAHAHILARRRTAVALLALLPLAIYGALYRHSPHAVTVGGVASAFSAGGAAVDGPGIRGLQPGADPQQGGLARPVLAGDCHDLPRVSLQADVAENGPAAVGLA